MKNSKVFLMIPIAVVCNFSWAQTIPILRLPTNAAMNVSQSGVRFTWDRAVGATGYRIIISQNSSFRGFNGSTCDSTCFTTTTGTTNYQQNLSLPGQPYYWKVYAHGANKWSTVSSFTTAGSVGRLIPPIAVGQKWVVCQGYNGSISHKANLAYSFDLSADLGSANGVKGCYSSGTNTSQGKKMYAPATGVIVKPTAYPSHPDLICLALDNPTTTGATSVLLGHVSLNSNIKIGSGVAKGMEIATVNYDAALNGSYGHIHISTFKSNNCSGASIPFNNIFGGSYYFPASSEVNKWRKTVLVR